jgi:hypothetical protein
MDILKQQLQYILLKREADLNKIDYKNLVLQENTTRIYFQVNSAKKVQETYHLLLQGSIETNKNSL